MLISGQFHKTEYDKYLIVFKLYESVSQTIINVINIVIPVLFFLKKGIGKIMNASVRPSVPLAIS